MSKLVAASVPLVLAMFAGVAHADGVYGTVGITSGTSPSETYQSEASPIANAHVGIGLRYGRIAVEAWAAGGRLDDECASSGDGPCRVGGATRAVGLDLRYVRPIGRQLSVYGRGRMSTMSLTTDYVEDPIYDGRGLGVGFGIQVEHGILGFEGAAYLEFGYDFYRLHADGWSSIDVPFTSFTVGTSFGSDT